MTTTNSIIDINSLVNKDNLKNSDYILVIIEICQNARKYKIKFSNTSKNFWDEVMNTEKLGNILRLFKAETIRKYWRVIREAHATEKIIEIVKANSDIINNPTFKLLPIINHIVSFINSKEESFENFLKKTDKKAKNERITFPPKKETSNEQLLSQKRKATTSIIQEDNIEEDIKILDKKIKEKEELEKKQNEDTLPLEEIIEVFHKQFETKTKDDIYQALYKTSCNIKNAYLFLVDPEKYDNLAFIGTDDYIIQNLKGKQYYEQLVASKGKELIKEREMFLNINQS